MSKKTWFKSRARKCEEEAKLDPNYRPTSELEADESADPEMNKTKFPILGVVIIGVLSLLIISCIIVIICLR